MEIPYVRIGTTFFKKVKKPLASADVVEILIQWNKETISSDHGKDYLAQIDCYDGFCSIPSHTDYKPSVGTFYNQYHELEYKPKKGKCENILLFLKHIFQEQYELGLDYCKILYEKPLQILPILCIVSEERGTGKTTFLNFMKCVFGKNMTLNTNDDFRSQFNSDWANMLLIAVDEVLLDKREDSERIKNLSTARQFKAEAKGKDRQEIEFFGKFILCSNNETSFIYLDEHEIRYWVIKVPTIKTSNKSTPIDFIDVLKSEIPAFLDYLLTRSFSTKNNSRMWFTPEQITTEALVKLKKNNKSILEKEIIETLTMIIEDEELECVKFQIQDIIASIRNLNAKNYSTHKVREIVSQKWKLSHRNSSYTRYIILPDGSITNNPHKGRYYELTLAQLEAISC